MLERGGSEDVALFLCASLSDGDVAGAYWMARSLEARGKPSPFASSLLAVVAGAFQVDIEAPALATSILDFVMDEVHPHEGPARYLAAAAAIRAVLDAPTTSLMDWLTPSLEIQGVRQVMEAVHAFAISGLPLPAQVQASIEGSVERARRIEAASASAREWLDQAPARSTKYQAATLVRTELLRGPIGSMLEPVAQNRRTEASQVLEHLRHLSVRSNIDRLIEDFDASRRKHQRMDGNARKWLYGLVEQACERAAEWHELVLLDQQLAQSNPGWVMQQVGRLTSEATKHLPSAIAVLDDLASRVDPQDAGALRVLQRALEWLGRRLNLIVTERQGPADLKVLQSLLEPGSRVRSVLARRLIVLPDLDLPGDGVDWDNALNPVASLLARAVVERHSLTGVIERWMSKRDFRFVSDLIECVEDGPEQDALRNRFEQELATAQADLRRHLNVVAGEIERAKVDGSTDVERAELSGRLDRISPELVLAFGPCFAELEEIERQLRAARTEWLAQHQKRWAELEPRLLAVGISPELRGQVAARVRAVIAAGDVRAADELIAHLGHVVDDGVALNQTLFEPTRRDSTLEDFLAAVPEFERTLRTIRGREVPRRFCEARGEAEVGRELGEVWSAWLRLSEARGSERLPDPLRSIMRFIGFELPPGTQNAFTGIRDQGSVTAFWGSLSARDAAFVPQFGSRANGRYRVVCAWSREGADQLGTALGALRGDEAATLVVYAGRLSLQQRRIARMQHKRTGGAVVILDEWLLLFLSRISPEERMRAFFRCTLPWGWVNPYSSRGGAVAPEMFFGRAEMARELAELEGTSLVYGGRQLGKSALLEHVQRQFHKPDERRYAVRIDINFVGDPAADTSPLVMWTRLRDELKAIKFLPPQVVTEKPDEIVRRILEQVNEREHRQLLILLDEADHFLTSDSKHGFKQVTLLRKLMEDSQRRCKVVLAGLHNVQRFQGIPNQPLAHFGGARLVGPLEPREAIRLITQPLEALGYRFKDGDSNSALLRILSYTNYHPGLLQLFCRNLLEAMHGRVDGQLPPYVIGEAEVDEVYRKKEVRDRIGERFEWTLALDARYQALVFSMIVHQAQAGSAFGNTFAVSSLLDEARYWWPAGFVDMQTDQLRGLLDEMVGLGVLVRTSQNAYRLRSPNVVRLLGAVDDIAARLIELGRRDPPGIFHADDHHAWLGGEAFRTSPFTHSQERQLLDAHPGAVLVFGSAATGLPLVPEALRHMARSEPGARVARVVEAPANLNHGPEFVGWLKATVGEHRNASWLIVHHVLAPKQAARGALVEEVESWIAARAGRPGPSIRVVFSMSPEAAWQWFSHAVRERPALEDVPATRLRRWSERGVRMLLERAELPCVDDSLPLRIATQTTGGWPSILATFVKKHAKDDARGAAESFEGECGSESAILAGLWADLGLEGVPLAREALSLVGQVGTIDDAGDLEALLEGLTAEQQLSLPALVEVLLATDCLTLADGKLHLAPLLAASLP